MITTNRHFTIDLHQHVGSLDVVSRTRSATSHDAPEDPISADVEARLAYLDAHEIDGCIVMPGRYPAPGSADSYRSVNTEVAAYQRSRPDRFLASLATADPKDPARAIDDMDHAVHELGAKGFVWHHHFLGTFVNDPQMWPLLERCQELGMPAFIHIITDSFLESPWRLEVLADDFPDLDFVALDGFSSPDQAMWMRYIAQKHPNIRFDTGVAQSVTHLLPAFIDEIGADRLLFGSDFYSSPKLFDVPFVLYELLNSSVEAAALDAVFGGNAAQLLDLDVQQRTPAHD